VRWTVAPQSGQARYPYTLPSFLDFMSYAIVADRGLGVCGIDRGASVKVFTAVAAKALDVRSRDRDGFFVLIEEEGIDEMAHENNAGLMIEAGAALDRTVALAATRTSPARSSRAGTVRAHDHRARDARQMRRRPLRSP
jgi:hypothetical protein